MNRLCPKNSPPQLRRGKPRPTRSASPIGRSLNKGRGWGGAGQENHSVDQHHPGAASFEASPYRARALRRHPSSAEEGSFYRFLVCALILLFVSIPTVWAQQDLLQQVGIDQKLDAPIDLSLPFRDEAG